MIFYYYCYCYCYCYCYYYYYYYYYYSLPCNILLRTQLLYSLRLISVIYPYW